MALKGPDISDQGEALGVQIAHHTTLKGLDILGAMLRVITSRALARRGNLPRDELSVGTRHILFCSPLVWAYDDSLHPCFLSQTKTIG